MSGCEKSGGDCAMRIGFPDLYRRPRCMGFSVMPGCDSCRCGGGKKNGLRPVRNGVRQLLRSRAVGGSRSVLRALADCLGVRDTARGLPEVWKGEARTSELVGGQS